MASMTNMSSSQEKNDLLTYIGNTWGEIPEGEERRGICPQCGRAGSFVVKKEKGCYRFWCYGEPCGTNPLRGMINYTLTSGDIISIIQSGSKSKSTKILLPKTVLRPLEASKEAMTLVTKYHCLAAYKRGALNADYYPQENRIIFSAGDEQVQAQNGRSLDEPPTPPKWKIWGKTNEPFFVKVTDKHDWFGWWKRRPENAVTIVEDSFSAGAVSEWTDAIALWSNNIRDVHIEYLLKKNYKVVFIWLDPDATHQAIKMEHRLRPFFKEVYIIGIGWSSDPKETKPRTALSFYEDVLLYNEDEWLRLSHTLEHGTGNNKSNPEKGNIRKCKASPFPGVF